MINLTALSILALTGLRVRSEITSHFDIPSSPHLLASPSRDRVETRNATRHVTPVGTGNVTHGARGDHAILDPPAGGLRLRLRSFGETKSVANLCAKNAKLFLREPLPGLCG